MEIEKLIEAIKLCGSTPSVYQCKQCAYWAGGDMSQCIPRMAADVADTLEQLQAENDRLKRERDAAVESWRGFCSQCAWKNHQYLADGKMDDMCRTCRDNAKCNWKWRGPKEE